MRKSHYYWRKLPVLQQFWQALPHRRRRPSHPARQPATRSGLQFGPAAARRRPHPGPVCDLFHIQPRAGGALPYPKASPGWHLPGDLTCQIEESWPRRPCGSIPGRPSPGLVPQAQRWPGGVAIGAGPQAGAQKTNRLSECSDFGAARSTAWPGKQDRSAGNRSGSAGLPGIPPGLSPHFSALLLFCAAIPRSGRPGSPIHAGTSPGEYARCGKRQPKKRHRHKCPEMAARCPRLPF